MTLLDDLVSGRLTLPMIPRVIANLLAMLRNTNCDQRALAEEIEQEPVLTSRILRLANSSFFAGRRSVGSVSDAVSLIGLRPIETMLIACGTVAAFAEVPGVNLRQFWLCSSITAAAARQLAARLRIDTETAYSAGLMQGVGHLILCMSRPQEAERHFARARWCWGEQLAELELAAFGEVHAPLSAAWADRMQLPEAMVDAIAHSLDGAHLPSSRLARTVQLATSVGASATLGVDAPTAISRLNLELVEMLELGYYLADAQFQTDFANLQTVPSVL